MYVIDSNATCNATAYPNARSSGASGLISALVASCAVGRTVVRRAAAARQGAAAAVEERASRA